MSNSTKMPSAAKIAEWKKEYHQVHKIVPDASRSDIFCIVRHPSMMDIISSAKVGGADDFLTGKSQLLDCWLAGSEVIKTDPELLKAASIRMGYIFQLKETKIEYLPISDEKVQVLLTNTALIGDVINRIKNAGEVRLLTVEISETEKAEAFLFKPELLDMEKASTGSDFVSSGMIYFQECLITCDEVLKNTTDDEILLSLYSACNSIFRTFAASVEKL